MKRIVIMFLLFVGFNLFAEIPAQERIEMSEKISWMVDIVNNGDLKGWNLIISPTARPGLKEEIITTLAGRKIDFGESIDSFKEVEGGRVKVKGSYSFKSGNTSIDGLSNFFTFEMTRDGWLLYDTNFYKKFNSSEAFWLVGIIFGAVFIIMIPLFAFWVWMLVDAITKLTESKVAWILVIIFAGFVGAIIYFFLVYRRRKKGYIQPEIK